MKVATQRSTDTEFVGDYDNPHGGYDTTTNKCKVCHAVHRAEGAYYLLRADSQDDACDYCHIGGSAHSSRVVYDYGKYTENGHTIGASTAIPDSSVSQWTEAVTLTPSMRPMNPISEDIQVRAYDATKASMYRFTRHHGHGDWGTGRSGYSKVGPAGPALHELPPDPQRHGPGLASLRDRCGYGPNERDPKQRLQAPQALPVRHDDRVGQHLRQLRSRPGREGRPRPRSPLVRPTATTSLPSSR